MSSSVLEVIRHYQKKLEKYGNDEKTVVHCLSKLDKLPINVQHLQATGIGRDINSIRKTEGQVGEKARALVQKWKAIVAAEDQSSEGEQAEERDDEDEANHSLSQSNSQSHQTEASFKNASPNTPSDKTANLASRSSNSVQSKSVSKESKDKDKHRKSSSESARSKDRHHHESSSSKQSSSSRHSSKSKKRKEEGNSDEDSDSGVTNQSGASFAQALGGLDTVVHSKKSHKEKKKEDKHKGKEKAEKVDRPSTSTEHVSTSQIDQSVKRKLDPIDLDLSSLSVPYSSSSSSLPVLTTNYRPLPRPMDCATSSLKKRVNDEEALAKVMSQKGARTKVYSGVKSSGLTYVPTLFDLCMRVLQDNIDFLEYTGGVPYDLLKPVLERASPTQLFCLEHHNPYLLEDSDELWKFHCERQFRGRERLEMETWRELYMRCFHEQEARLKNLTANIQSSMAKAKPVRQTKLAYVESAAKPPRGVARNQIKHGTSAAAAMVMQKTAMGQIKAGSRPFESGGSSSASSGSANEPVVVPPPSRSGGGGIRREDSGSAISASAAKKPKVAPLMQKTLKFIKNRYRR